MFSATARQVVAPPRRYYRADFLDYVKASAGIVPVAEILTTAAGLYQTTVSKTQLYQLCHVRGWSLIPHALSGQEVATVMGVTYVAARRFWLTGDPPLLTSRGRYSRFGPYDGGQWWVLPGDLYQFVYHHPEAYDWRVIRREPYRAWGKQATERQGILFLDEIAARLGVPYNTVLHWIRRYVIPGVVHQPIGRVRWRFRPEALAHLRTLQRESYRGRRGAPPFPLRPPVVTEPARLLALLAVEMVGGEIRVRPLAP
jgi:hypothetical protein